MARVTLPNGQWAELRPMTGNDLIALSSADKDMAGVVRRMGQAVTAHSFDGDILDQPWSTLRLLLPGWRTESEAEALPLAPEGSSPAPSVEQP